LTELRRDAKADHYKILQVDSDAEPEVVEAAYRALSKKYHPDINRAPEAMDRMAQINAAYTVLSDSSRRRDYDYLRASQNRQATATPPRKPDSSFTPSAPVPPASATANQPKPGATPRPTGTPPKPGASSFRPQDAPRPTGTTPNPKPEDKAREAARNRTGPTYYDEDKKRRNPLVLVLVGIIVLLILGVGAVLGMEAFFGNPLKTSFVTTPPPIVPTVPPTRQPVSNIPPGSPAPAGVPTKEQITAYLSNPEFYAGRVADVVLPNNETVNLRVKLNPNGAVLNSDAAPAQRAPDELDGLRQSEATAYNLIYTLFARYQDLSRINLILTDVKDKPLYRADVTRSAAFSFNAWHGTFNLNDPAETAKAARQDRLILHVGTPIEEAWRNRLNNPTDAAILAELQNIGLSAVQITASGQTPVVNYYQVRSQPETAVDFARILYTLYTRFPTLDRVQIVLGGDPNKPTKFVDRTTFAITPLEVWSQASYGGAAAGGDRQAQTLVAALPNNQNELKQPAQTVQAKFKTPVQVGSWAVVVEQTDRFENLTLEGQRIPAGNGRQFLVVRIALRNGSDGRQWLFPGERMALFDTTRNVALDPDPAATLLYILKTPPADLPPAPLDTGKQGAVYAVFNVPTGANLATFRLEFQDADKRGLLELA
jgi:hypothetical protein